MNRTALDQLEEALGLLRRQSVSAWVLYLAGAVPFTLAVLKLVHDMTSGYGAKQSVPDSFFCAAAFLWSNFWKARFSARLLVAIRGDNATPLNSVFACAFVQGVLQTGKLFLLPFAAASVVPFPWVSTMFRAACTGSNRPDAGIRNTLRRAASQAAAESRKNWAALLLCTAGALVVLLNVFTVVMLLPQLFRSFTGAETDWTRGRFFIGQMFVVSIAVTWLLLDPVLQAYSVVRSFYLQSKVDGRDLLARLSRLAAMSLLACILAGAPSQAAPSEPNGITLQQVRQSIQQVTRKEQYRWLFREAHGKDDDWFGARILRDLDAVGNTIEGWFHKLAQWWDDLFGKRQRHDQRTGTEPSAPSGMTWLVGGISLLLLATTVFVILQRRRSQALSLTASASANAMDPKIEEALASDRPHEEWLTMAHEYAARGEFRLAIRAMYLANLSYLGAQQWLGITKSKTNAMYERELRYRHRVDELCAAFARTNRQYERVWYGMHELSPETRDRFQQDMEVIRNHA